MAGAALAALVLDFLTKTIAVAAAPRTLLFHVSSLEPFGLGASLILVAAATSLMACVLPTRVVAVGSGVALGGGLGNLASRYWWNDRGGSPDFIRLPDGSTANVADFFIATGLATTLVGSVVWLGWTIAVRHT
jgi:lipoprotein signal peptidase